MYDIEKICIFLRIFSKVHFSQALLLWKKSLFDVTLFEKNEAKNNSYRYMTISFYASTLGPLEASHSSEAIAAQAELWSTSFIFVYLLYYF